MTPRAIIALLLSIIGGQFLAWIYFQWGANQSAEKKARSAPAPALSFNARLFDQWKLPATSPLEAKAEEAKLRARIQSLLQNLSDGRTTAGELAALETDLTAAPRTAATASIVEFLTNGLDAPTGDEFSPGDGRLEHSPSLRIFLLDLLGRLARENDRPEASALARNVLEHSDSADEWVIALRNLAWQQSKNRALLAEKIRALLTKPEWLANPTAGFIHALDIVPALADPTLLPLLESLLAGSNADLQQAAANSIERLAEAAPLEVMTLLIQRPLLLKDQPQTRADAFAKANLVNATQRRAVESYLTRSDVGTDEKSRFLRRLAVPTTFLGDSLTGRSSAPPEPAIHAARTLPAVRDWMSDPRFVSLQPELQALEKRLQP